MEVVVLDEVIQIDREQFERYDQMLPKDHIVLNPNNVERVVRVIQLQVHQYLQLHPSLVLEPPLVANQFDRDEFLRLVVEAFKCLAKAALAQELYDLKAVGDVVLHDHLVVPSLIVKAKVVRVQG